MTISTNYTKIIALPLAYLMAICASCCQGTEKPKPTSDKDTEDSWEESDTDEQDTDSGSGTETVDDDSTIPLTCEQAAETQTSVGCEFFAVDLDNYDGKDSYTFSVTVANPSEDLSAEVTIEHVGSGESITENLNPLELKVVDAACDGALCLVEAQEIDDQGLGEGKAFRITSDVPILASQWNPYGLNLATTDASLLFPVASLGSTYIAIAWGFGGTEEFSDYSQVTVVATEDNTNVSFLPGVDVPEQNGIGPFTAGIESGAYALDMADVLAFRPTELHADLTGTVVLADKPVAVFGGHSCAYVPDDLYDACDHVEEQIPPIEAWGTSAVLARYAPRDVCTGIEDRTVWRLVAGSDDMAVVFDPPAPLPAGEAYSFAQQGEVLEFLGDSDYLVSGFFNNPEDPDEPEAPFFAYQMMTGVGFPQCGAGEPGGDPFMLQVPPAGQFLDRYVFTTSQVLNFDYDHIIITRESGTEIELDCLGSLAADSFQSVGDTTWEVGRIFIDNPENTTGCMDGAHVIEGSAPFGLSVVGVSYANSYGFVGGTGARTINPAPVIE